MQVPGPATQPAQVVHWTVNGEWRSVHAAPAEVRLHLAANVALTLQCQRCLEGVTVDVQASRSFLFVHGEAQAAALDEQTEDDVLPITRSLDLISLVEDELLLALPLVPHHLPSCPEPLPLPPSEIAADAHANPFAALAALNRPGGRLN
ncbi:MAG: YceD family protein [Burkholderiaceae bacterium]